MVACLEDNVSPYGYILINTTWSCKTCKDSQIVNTSKPTPKLFYRLDALPVAEPSVEALKGKTWRLEVIFGKKTAS